VSRFVFAHVRVRRDWRDINIIITHFKKLKSSFLLQIRERNKKLTTTRKKYQNQIHNNNTTRFSDRSIDQRAPVDS